MAPGLLSPAQWIQWTEAATLPAGELIVDLPRVPSMSRRRLGRLAKMAVSVADDVLEQAQSADIPVVWASRYGDADKSLALLQSQAVQEPMSPAAFGLSVHNGIGAQHSILRGMHANAVCVASSHCAPEAGVVEAMGLLHEGAPEILLVCYDEPLPQTYSQFHDQPSAPFAWAALLTCCVSGVPGFSLQAMSDGCDVAETSDRVLPHGLDVLHFLLTPERQALQRHHASGLWQWERLHA
ncbi:hypothetical protein B2J86_07940 [Acidovorax sp. SRB_14]|uniref:beta-ketoacyl synthase chain length factor n=1 Tax=Acidovorax sp. SRB_14 TaxID=1962699 RepID=UPI001566C4B6|nr:beta-ketoacyl synthase chain length factor [Acidovorax sp. SRB_14]NMM80862.1 hypothetical protein [Acidovorax sp. SRB_14]